MSWWRPHADFYQGFSQGVLGGEEEERESLMENEGNYNNLFLNKLILEFRP